MSYKARLLQESMERTLSSGQVTSEKIPLIGITGNFAEGKVTLASGYYRCVERAGGVPVVIPPTQNPALLDGLLKKMDGLLLTGGGDLDPAFLDEKPLEGLDITPERDLPELLLVRLAARRHLPVLGVCRGIQIMAAALGGSLYQDIYTECPGVMPHNVNDNQVNKIAHAVAITPGTVLASLFPDKKGALVNSFHHQAVKTLPKGFVVAAVSQDGLTEAMESQEEPMLGVQWHPERMVDDADDNPNLNIFRWLVSEARMYKDLTSMHSRFISIDTHSDTPIYLVKGADLMNCAPVPVEYSYVGETSPDGSQTFDYTTQVDIRRMYEGRLDATCMAAYLRQGELDMNSLDEAVEKANLLLSLVENSVKGYGQNVIMAKTPEHLLYAKQMNLKAVIPVIENGYAIGSSLENVERFARRGVVYMTLCHNGDNLICGSAKGRGEHGGLTDFGKLVVDEMNRQGMIIDLSHASSKTFWEVLERSKAPLLCSHSSARALCDHPRNLTDAQLVALAGRGGLVNVCMYHGFLREDGEASVDDAVRHILHMVNLIGANHVGIGSDFDGGGGVSGFEHAGDCIKLTRKLLQAGLTEGELCSIWGANFLNLWREVRRNGACCHNQA